MLRAAFVRLTATAIAVRGGLGVHSINGQHLLPQNRPGHRSPRLIAATSLIEHIINRYGALQGRWAIGALLAEVNDRTYDEVGALISVLGTRTAAIWARASTATPRSTGDCAKGANWEARLQLVSEQLAIALAYNERHRRQHDDREPYVGAAMPTRWGDAQRHGRDARRAEHWLSPNGSTVRSGDEAERD